MAGRGLIAATVAVVAASWGEAAAQEPKRIAVMDFDQTQVQSGFREIFGRENVNVGRSIARLIGARLAAAGGIQVVESSGSIPFTMDPTAAVAAGRAAGADAVVAGSLVVYGTASGTAGGGPRVGPVRVNIGRRTTVAVVTLEARLIDVQSGAVLGVVPGHAQGSRSGLAIQIEVPNLIDASGLIDMTRDDFRRTLIGQFTEDAVGQLVTGVVQMRDRIGTLGAPVAAAPAAPPAAAPSGGVAYSGGPFMWTPYQFRGTERFRYDVSVTENSATRTGFYVLELQPAGAGNVRMSVQGQLGTDQWSSSVTVPVGAEGPGAAMYFGPLMTMGPIGVLLFNPASWILMGGRQLSVGDGWSSSSGGESVSVRVESQCSHAGQGGLLIVVRTNNQVSMESCVSPAVALPLRTLVVDEGERMEMRLTEFRP